MIRKLRFHPDVPGDLVSALNYYEQISPKLADRFRENIDQKFDQIVERPESFPTDVEAIRFAKIKRFPYLIFFVVKEKTVLVIAILHGAMNPQAWRTRR